MGGLILRLFSGFLGFVLKVSWQNSLCFFFAVFFCYDRIYSCRD